MQNFSFVTIADNNKFDNQLANFVQNTKEFLIFE